jgi:ribosomal protein S27E
MKEVLAIQQEQKYKRHRPETTLLYQLVERYYPEFTTNLAEQGKYLPKYVEREFDEFLRCGRLEYGFLRVVCGDCKHEKLVAFSCKRRGFLVAVCRTQLWYQKNGRKCSFVGR